jgi:hypothetical protein
LREALARDDSAVSEKLRKKYRAIIRRKKRSYSKVRAAQLVETCNRRNPSKFWKRFKKRLQRVGVKGKAEWYAYCKGLYAGVAFERRGSDLWRAEGLESEGLEEKRAQAASLNECFMDSEEVTELSDKEYETKESAQPTCWVSRRSCFKRGCGSWHRFFRDSSIRCGVVGSFHVSRMRGSQYRCLKRETRGSVQTTERLPSVQHWESCTRLWWRGI